MKVNQDMIIQSGRYIHYNNYHYSGVYFFRMQVSEK